MFSFLQIQRTKEQTVASCCLPVCSRTNRIASLSFFALLLLSGALSAQVGIGTTDPQKDLDVNGTFQVTGASTLAGGLTLGATGITTTGAEFNVLDGSTPATSTTVVSADGLVFNDNGTMKQITVSDLLNYFNVYLRPTNDSPLTPFLRRQQGLDIDGEAAGDFSGYSVSLSSDGSTVAIGANGNDGAGSDAGHVRVYAIGTGSGMITSAERSKLQGIEALADVTDATNVAAAGAVMNTGAETIAGVKTFTSNVIANGTITVGTLQGGNLPVHGNARVWDANTRLKLFYPTVTSNTVLNDPKPLLVLGRDGTSGEAYGALATFNLSRYENSSTGSRTRLDLALTHDNYDDVDVMTLLSSGSVGIGTTAPSYNLHVTGDGRFSDGLTVSNVAADSYTKYLFFGSDTGVSSNIPYIQGGGTGTSYAMALNPNGGDVGIGTTAPSYKLDVNGDGHYTGGLNVDGYVGIGTTSSSYPLHITSSGPSTATHAHYGTFNSPASYMDPGQYNRIGIGWTNGYYTNTYVALKVDYGIWASTVTTTSDERVKDIAGISNSEDDLSTLSSIEVTDYKMKDVVKYGNQTAKKVIAQQLTSVYPQAVSLQTGVIPNIYKVAEIKEGYVALQTDLKKGDRVKLIFIENEQEQEEIVEVLDADQRGFTIENKKNGKVFVYGQEVDDFHVVDYSAVSMLNVSATQELYKLIQEQEATIAAQQQELTSLQQTSDARFEAVVARLNALESMGTKVSNDQ